MSDQPSERLAHLEWLLQSGPANDRELAFALVDEHYRPLYQLALSSMDDTQEAGEIARRALVEAAVQAHTFTGQSSISEWLAAIVGRICRGRLRRRAFRRIADKFLGDGQATCEVSQLSPDLSAENLDAIKWEIHRLVARERRRRPVVMKIKEIVWVGITILFVLLGGRMIASLAPHPTPIATVQRVERVTQVVYVYQTPTPSAPTPFSERAILYTVEEGDTLSLVAEFTGVHVEILGALNGMPPDQLLLPGQQIVIGFGAPPMSAITPTLVTPAILLEALTVRSSAEAIQQRVQKSKASWNTLWADVQIVRYGPASYVGPPQIVRQQIWLAKTDLGLALSGGLDGQLDHVWRMVDNLVYDYDLEFDRRNIYGTSGEMYGITVAELFSPFRGIFGGELEVVGQAQVAGRDTLIVDWYMFESVIDSDDPIRYYEGRYWVDTLTGVILRRQRFENSERGVLSEDVIVTAISFDMDFPTRLFDKYRPLPDGFAQDYRSELLSLEATPVVDPSARAAGHRPLPHRTPPEDFDPSHWRLTFQWTQTVSLGAAISRADVFAKPYYLGNAIFGDPDRLICSRSPDGRLIAFSEWPDWQTFAVNGFRWLDLFDLSKAHDPLPEISVRGAIEFAPDSRRVAFQGCTGLSDTDCSVFVVDLSLGRGIPLQSAVVAYGLTWSPDGRFLAYIGSPHVNESVRIWVVNANNGQVVYSGLPEYSDTHGEMPAADSPIQAWGVPFPSLPIWGIENCSRPPNVER